MQYLKKEDRNVNIEPNNKSLIIVCLFQLERNFRCLSQAHGSNSSRNNQHIFAERINELCQNLSS